MKNNIDAAVQRIVFALCDNMDVHLDGPIKSEDVSLVKSRIKHATEVSIRRIIEEEITALENPQKRAEQMALSKSRGFWSDN